MSRDKTPEVKPKFHGTVGRHIVIDEIGPDTPLVVGNITIGGRPGKKSSGQDKPGGAK